MLEVPKEAITVPMVVFIQTGSVSVRADLPTTSVSHASNLATLVEVANATIQI